MRKFILPAIVLIGLCLLNNMVFAQLTQSYTVINNTGMVVTAVNISANDANSWGPGINTKSSIAKDESFEFKHAVDKNNCIYDLRFTGEDGKYYYMQDVDLCKNTTFALFIPDSEIKNDGTNDNTNFHDDQGKKVDDRTNKTEDKTNMADDKTNKLGEPKSEEPSKSVEDQNKAHEQNKR